MIKISLYVLLIAEIKFLRVSVFIDFIRNFNTSSLCRVTCKFNTTLSPINHFICLATADAYHFSHYIFFSQKYYIMDNHIPRSNFWYSLVQRNNPSDYCEHNLSENITLDVMARYQFWTRNSCNSLRLKTFPCEYRCVNNNNRLLFILIISIMSVNIALMTWCW